MKVSRGILIFLISVSLLQLNRCATPGSVESPDKNYFVKFYGDDGDHTGVDMVVNTDGTMVLLGTITQPGKKTLLYVVKADAFGNILKQSILGDSLLDHEAKDIELIPNSSGDFAILANVFSSPTNRDILLMTLDGDLTVKEQIKTGFVANDSTQADDNAVSVSRTNDGFIVAGSTGNLQPTPANREGLFVRYMENPLRLAPSPWLKKPSGAQGPENVTTRIFQLADGSFYGFGYSKWAYNGGPQTDFNFWYFSLSEDGTLGGPPNDPLKKKGTFSYGVPGTDEKLFSVATPWPFASDSTFFLAGLTTDPSGNADLYMVKLSGVLEFKDSLDVHDWINIPPKSFGLQLLKPTREWVSVCETKSGYLILTNENTLGSNNLLLTKIQGFDGIKPWSIPLIYGGVGDDFAGSVSELPDGRILIMGTMAIGQKDGETKMVLMKVNNEGKFAN